MSQTSPAEALRSFHGHPRPVDLLLTDVVMPGMSGVELAARIRQLAPDLPILYMSGDPGSLVDHKTLPPDTRFLTKPFAAQTLVAAVEEALCRQKH